MAEEIDVELWHKRIQAARRRRDEVVDDWATYCRLYTNSQRAAREANEDASVFLPNGDQIKLSLVFRNIEQTRAILDFPEVGLRATAQDYTRELGPMDTHRESVIEQGLLRSLYRSGLLTGTDEAEKVKFDGLLIGHGINYTYYREVTDSVETMVPVFSAAPDGSLQPVFDPTTGEHLLEPEITQHVVWEGCGDRHVSPIQFLFASHAKDLFSAEWHGDEEVVTLDLLRNDSRYANLLTPELKTHAFRLRDIYGDEQDEAVLVDDAVRIVRVYHKPTRMLMEFLETAPPELAGKAMAKYGLGESPKSALLLVDARKIGVQFDSPDSSPYNFFVPIPANDRWCGISQVEHIRNPSVEADKTRTRWANWVRELRRLMWYNKNQSGLGEAIREALNSPKVSPVGLNISDDVSPDKMFGEFSTPNLNMEVFRASERAEGDVHQISGVPNVPYTGADTATESENIMQIGGARPKRKARLYLQFLAAVAATHKAFLAHYAPEGQVMQLIALDGTPLALPFGREAFAGEYRIEVTQGGGTMTITPVQQKLFTDMAAVFMGKFGPGFDLLLTREFLTKVDMRNLNALMMAARQGVGLAPPGPGQAQIPGQTPDTNLNDVDNGQAIRAAINAPYEARAR